MLQAATADLTHEPGLVIGSEDATTCVIAVAECRNSGLVSAVHVDEGVSSAQTASHLLAGMSRPQIYLCGAYCDKESKGPKVASAILRHLHNGACLASRISAGYPGVPLVAPQPPTPQARLTATATVGSCCWIFHLCLWTAFCSASLSCRLTLQLVGEGFLTLPVARSKTRGCPAGVPRGGQYLQPRPSTGP